MKRMVIMMGIPGSGKSTFFHRYLQQDFVRVNLDTLKTRHREKLLIEDCIAKGCNYAIDNTNPQKADREHGCLLAVADKVPSPRNTL